MCSFTIILFLIGLVSAQQDTKDLLRTGRYNPQIFGAAGWYIPDNRGKYQHIHVPYDGGYGDRGEKYLHDEDYRFRYWQVNDPNGYLEEPYDEFYNQRSSYASEQYNPSPSIPEYIPQEWHPGEHTYAPNYKYDQDGWRIIQFKWSRDGKMRYSFFYETENKILAQEIGKLAKLNENSSAIRVDGFYQYEGDDGTVYEVDYVANENGFFPTGKHIHPSIKNILDFLMKNATEVRVPEN